jgi:peptidyl-prolyl cis-trans isomerase C
MNESTYQAITSKQRRWWLEPLLWFALGGVFLFWVNAQFIAVETNNRIEVGPLVEQRISDQWQVQMGRLPSAEELQGLVDQWLKEEVYYREALRLGLDANDTIVRRRLVQKLTFLTEDIATAEEPSEAELTQHYEQNAQQYQQPARYSFRHRYFSADRREEAETEAKAALQQLAGAPAQGEATRNLGDPFMLQLAFAERSQRQIADLFGREFGAALPDLSSSQWVGPIQSAYGWHLVYITAVLPERQQPLAEVRDRVTADLTLSKRQSANTRYYQDLLSNYDIVRL